MHKPSLKSYIFVIVLVIVLSLIVFGLAACTSKVSLWSVTLEGARTEVMPQADFEDGAGCHVKTYTDAEGKVWEGMPLWYLVGRVDDDQKHKSGAFSDSLADAGYEITVASAGASVKFTSQEVKRNDNIIVACKMNGAALSDSEGPLKLVGSGVDQSRQIGKITSIKLSLKP